MIEFIRDNFANVFFTFIFLVLLVFGGLCTVAFVARSLYIIDTFILFIRKKYIEKTDFYKDKEINRFYDAEDFLPLLFSIPGFLTFLLIIILIIDLLRNI
jgi:hypothetical protein